MRLLKTGNLLLLLLIIASCGSTNFMGARLYESNGFYVARFYENPKNSSALPSGTAIYREARENINNFIIKYYISDKRGSEIEIPAKDMWKVKHNGKYYTEQDDDYFFYVRDGDDFKKYHVPGADCCLTIGEDIKLLPIKECYEDGLCKLYPTAYPETLYVKKSILYRKWSENR
jgi:hypothetical protein